MTDTQFAEYERLRAQELATNIADYFKNIGIAPTRCGKCNEAVYWVTHKTANKAPYNASNLRNHLKTCVKGEQHSRDHFNSPEEFAKRHSNTEHGEPVGHARD